MRLRFLLPLSPAGCLADRISSSSSRVSPIRYDRGESSRSGAALAGTRVARRAGFPGSRGGDVWLSVRRLRRRSVLGRTKHPAVQLFDRPARSRGKQPLPRPRFFPFPRATRKPNTPSLLQVDLAYALYAESQTMESAGTSFSIDPSVLKLTVRVARWNFTPTAEVLSFRVSIRVSPACASIARTDSGNVTTFSVASSPLASGAGVMSASIGVLTRAIADGVAVPVGIDMTPTGDGSTLVVTMTFPRFNESLVYDPDFSVALSGGEGGSTSGSDLGLVALVALAAIPCAMVVAAVAVASIASLIWSRSVRRRGQKDSINFEVKDAPLSHDPGLP